MVHTWDWYVGRVKSCSPDLVLRARARCAPTRLGDTDAASQNKIRLQDLPDPTYHPTVWTMVFHLN